MGFVGRLLSYGESDAVPEQLARHIRVSNGLALLGAVLNLAGLPVDIAGAPLALVFIDFTWVLAFVACLALNARGHHHVARAVLMITSNAAVLGGLVQLGGVAELRTLLLPFALLPFLVFSLAEWKWIVVFAAVPVAGYFLTASIEPAEGLALTVYKVYAPALAFLMIIAGAAVFAYVQRSGEAKLVQTRARAAQSARLAALGEMSTSIAHEIRNPLAAIHIAATQIVELSGQPEHVAELGDRIRRIVMRASSIIEGLRSFSRDASGDPFVETSVARILTDTLELCGKRLTENGVTLDIAEVTPDLVVQCRPIQLSQVLMNLLGNACDALAAATDEKWIRVEVHADAEWLEVAVSNSGPLIPKPLRLRIFEPFFTTKSADRGTGLGLSLSRGAIEAHRGTLELDTSAPCTRFVMRVPRVQVA